MKSQFLDYTSSLVYDKSLPTFIRSVGHFNLLKIDKASCKLATNFGELFWCIDGKVFFEHEKNRKFVRPGEVWYYPPDSNHYFGPVDSHFHYRWFTIEGFHAAALFSAAGLTPGCSFGGQCPEELFVKLEMGISHPERNARLNLLSVGFSILCLAASGVRRKIHWLEEVRNIMDANFTDPEFNIELLANIIHMNRVQVSRGFSSRFGIQASAYLKALRLQHGLKLLRETSLSIAEISAMSGYSSPDYFGKVVMGSTGLSPSQHRRRH